MRPVDEAKPINARRRTASTEVHWIPRTGSGRTTAGLHEWAVVDRAVGDRDWAEIDPMRVRKSKGVRHRFTPAMYYWQRSGSHVWCESQLERWEVLWLGYSGQVERLWSQPLALTFGHGTRLSGDSHAHDLLALFTDGSMGLFDVRPAERIDEHARVQFDETATICGALGWRYKVLTGHDNRATANLDCLSASRHDRCRPAPATESRILELADGGRPRGELCRIIAPDCPLLACAWSTTWRGDACSIWTWLRYSAATPSTPLQIQYLGERQRDV